jgi:KDO2-lipid IV(A) lauroyltransferase
MLSYVLYLTASFLIKVVPRRLADSIASIIAFLFFVFRSTIRRNVRENYRALGLEEERAFPVFRNFSRAIVDFLKYSGASAEAVRQSCRIAGREHLDQALAGGRGAILYMPHIGPWEIAGACLASLGYPVRSVALEHQSKQVTRFFSEWRERWGIIDYPPGECVGKLLRALGNGEVVALLVDRKFSGRGMELEFFGRTVTLPDGHVILSLRTGSPLIPCWCYYNERGKINAVIDEPIEGKPGEYTAQELGRLCLERIEKRIVEHHEQWFAFDHLWPEEDRE